MSELNNGKVLLLDDDTFLVDIYEEKFNEAACSVQATHTVDEAMRVLRGGFVPDVVLLDLEIPQKDGFLFLQMLKQEHLAEGAHLIALTNHSDEQDRARAKELGADPYIIKAEMIPDEVVKLTLEIMGKKNTAPSA